MIVFPEVATHGYTSFDWFLDKDIIETVEDPLEKIIPATENITAIVGVGQKKRRRSRKKIIQFRRRYS
jgi:predicted amidohydrolase